MSSSSEFSSQRPATARFMEKPSFSMTCSLLSQYLKEKGTFGDLSLGMTCNAEPTTGTQELSLLRPTATATTTTTTMNLFPQQSGFVSSVSKEDIPKMADSRVNKPAAAEPEAAQMTIFYAGQVIVFDNFQADKAKEVMLLASKGSPQSHTTLPPKSQISFDSNPVRNPMDAASMNPPIANVLPNYGNNLIQENVQRRPPQPVVCDLPIARRASLHRFLEKRKDRITAKPYQKNITDESPSPPKPVQSRTWLGLAGQSSQQFQC